MSFFTKFGFFCVTLFELLRLIKEKNKTMKKHQIHILKRAAGLSSMKEELTKEVEQFLDIKVNEGFEVVAISFTYYEAHELIAFVTLCK